MVYGVGRIICWPVRDIGGPKGCNKEVVKIFCVEMTNGQTWPSRMMHLCVTRSHLGHLDQTNWPFVSYQNCEWLLNKHDLILSCVFRAAADCSGKNIRRRGRRSPTASSTFSVRSLRERWVISCIRVTFSLFQVSTCAKLWNDRASYRKCRLKILRP